MHEQKQQELYSTLICPHTENYDLYTSIFALLEIRILFHRVQIVVQNCIFVEEILFFAVCRFNYFLSI